MRQSRKILKETWALTLPILIGMVLGALLCWVIDQLTPTHSEEHEKVETVTVVDTVTITQPTPVGSTQIGTGTYIVPVHSNKGKIAQDSARATADTVGDDTSACDVQAVELPIIQRHYTDSLYEAWVSGPVDPRLDSVKVVEKRTVTTITREVYKPPNKWHVGITTGVGYAPSGLQPYIGVGITYSIISF